MAFLAAIPALIGSVAGTAAAGSSLAAGASAAIAGGGAAASTIPGWVGLASLGASAIGGAAGAYGSYMQGQATAGAAKYNAAISKEQAALSEQKATMAGQAGEQQAAMQEQKTRATVGAIKAAQAGSGLEVDVGSAPDVRASAAELGQLDALTIRSNAAKEAYGYRTQAVSEKAQSALDEFEAKSASEAGTIGAASTFLGGLGSAATNWAKYQMAGGL